MRGNFGDPATYRALAEFMAEKSAYHHTGLNFLFYLATPPSVFGPIAVQLGQAGLARRDAGWSRLVIEKPFGTDLISARALNKELLSHWSEEQIFRIDHYLGKETVQNLLAFRFANGMFEPLWNKSHVEHIQMTVAESVGVEARGRYYDRAGALRDMIQSHMLQMLAYVCMEPPASLRADALRNEKSKLLEAVRILKPDEIAAYTVRGQYGPGQKPSGAPAVGYRQEADVAPNSATETFAALKLCIENWRWDGVPVYLRSGKSLWKRGTEIVVQFRKAPEIIFRQTPAARLVDSNRLIFHVQPDQGIEIRFQAKAPGPEMQLQKVNMRFDYREAFVSPRGTGYEVLFYNCMIGDATLFARSDVVEASWKIVQPILDTWSAGGSAGLFSYPAGSWGPKEAFDLLERDGGRWTEVVNRDVLERVPLFHGAEPALLQNMAMMLRPVVCAEGEYIIRQGEMGNEMYFICRGRVEVIDAAGRPLNEMGEGQFFGELSLLFAQPRNASVRALTYCDLFALGRTDFDRVLKGYPHFAASVKKTASERTHDK